MSTPNTTTPIVLDYLRRHGGEQSAAQIAEGTGLSESQAYQAARRLLDNGELAGRWVPGQRGHTMRLYSVAVDGPEPSVPLVQRALAAQPALVTAWHSLVAAS